MNILKQCACPPTEIFVCLFGPVSSPQTSPPTCLHPIPTKVSSLTTQMGFAVRLCTSASRDGWMTGQSGRVRACVCVCVCVCSRLGATGTVLPVHRFFRHESRETLIFSSLLCERFMLKCERSQVSRTLRLLVVCVSCTQIRFLPQ